MNEVLMTEPPAGEALEHAYTRAAFRVFGLVGRPSADLAPSARSGVDPYRNGARPLPRNGADSLGASGRDLLNFISNGGIFPRCTIASMGRQPGHPSLACDH